jgi:hypothetical protein
MDKVTLLATGRGFAPAGRAVLESRTERFQAQRNRHKKIKLLTGRKAQNSVTNGKFTLFYK